MWIWIVAVAIALVIVYGRVKGQNAEKAKGLGPKCQFCGARMKYNQNRTGWLRVCRKCGREQVTK